MPLFRPRDAVTLALVHPDLVKVVNAYADAGGRFIVSTGMRGKAAQEAAHASGHSNAHFGQSPHNYNPALAVDLQPADFPHSSAAEYVAIAKGMKAAAKKLGVAITWGGDFHSIHDAPHFELTGWHAMAKVLAA